MNLQDPEDCIRWVLIKCDKCLTLPIPMPAVEDPVEAAGELVMVEEAATEVLMPPFQGKHQRLEPART